MRQLVVITLASGLLLARPTVTPSHTAEAVVSSAYHLTTETGGVVVQSSEEALAQDLALAADARGWTTEEAAAYQRAEQTIGLIAERVAAERPDAFVGSALSPRPDGAPTLYIKGPADQFIRDLASDAPIEIEIADNQQFSFGELETRKLRVYQAIQALGFKQVVTGVNITSAGAILASVTREPGLDVTVDAIRSRLPADLESSVKLTIRDAPIVVRQGAFGGMWMRDNGVNWCTSGWTIKNSVGTRGVSAAGHCNHLDQINHPGHGLHAAYWQASYEGGWGDVEWHTTAYYEADDFYSDATTIRDVASVEPVASISVNEVICVYGRASNVRNCSLEVRDASIVCGGLNRLVQMNGAVTVGGDSGAGWSWVSKAYGGHMGLCDGFSSFSVADLFDEALGISVATS